MSDLTHLSLFSGIGGLDLAGERAGFRTVGQCEWADYPHAVLEKHWPDVPKWRDIRTLTKEGFRERTGLDTVTVLSGGFPCQPFSTAGKRRGKEDDRYLWPEMLRVISEIRPTWVVGENVAGLVSLALDTVLSDLEGIGYICQTLIIPACAVDAPHRRDRCAILGYSNDSGNGASGHGCKEWVPGGQERQHLQYRTCGSGQAVANTDGNGFKGLGSQFTQGRNINSQHLIISEGHDVPNSNDWCRDVRRNRELSTAEIAGDWGVITTEERRSMAAGNGGQLNPTWVEWLMGFPLGWTDLSASEMPSCPSSSTQSSRQ